MIFVFSRISGNVRYDWQWYRVKRYLFTAAEGRFTFGPLLRGLGVTLWISLISLLFSFLIGTLTLLARLSEGIVAPVIARLYVSLIRNTPLLIQLFLSTLS